MCHLDYSILRNRNWHVLNRKLLFNVGEKLPIKQEEVNG